MASASGDGPDASSLKPVSSLRAQFENLKKPPPPATGQPSRTVSPAPKPEHLRNGTNPPPVVGNKPIVRPKSQAIQPLPGATSLPPPPPTTSTRSDSPARSILPAPISPRPPFPPSLTVEPPSSPPKLRAPTLSLADSSSFLNPDSVVTPTSPASGSHHFRIPSRTLTPTVETRRSPRLSPRLSSSKPPSPPPPRRSGEIRRDRDTRQGASVANDTDRPRIPSRASYRAESSPVFLPKSTISQEASPFNSPPSSHGSQDEEDAPPDLPARPPQQVGRPSTVRDRPTSFEPPPVHHSIASRRRDKDSGANGNAEGYMFPQVTGERRPALPARPQTYGQQPSLVPPRPDRPTFTAPPSATDVHAATVTQKRVVSASTAQFGPPPTRIHGRSNTVVDRSSVRNSQVFASSTVSTTSVPAPQAATGIAPKLEPVAAITNAFPDSSNVNRRPPYVKQGAHEIVTKYDPRVIAVCAEYACTTGSFTRVWNVLDGELVMSLAHSEGIRGTSLAFKPASDVLNEGARIWIGNNFGEIMEVDVATSNVVALKSNIHGRLEVIRIYRHLKSLWTLDEGGTLHVWSPRGDGTPTLDGNPSATHRVPRGHTYSIAVGDKLWHATGKEIRVFHPETDGSTQFQVLLRALFQESAGEVTAGTLLTTDVNKVIFGHNDGKVSIYSSRDYSCLQVLNVSAFKINCLAAIGSQIWAGYNNGRVSVFDMSEPVWTIKKEWSAHETPVVKLVADRSSMYKLDRTQVISLGMDNVLRIWDGSLQDDWLEGEMKARDSEYCDFDTLGVQVMTWNVGASTPHSLRYSETDADFMRDLVEHSGSPDIMVFGFQELVDLEDKTATAKRLLKSKKKDHGEAEHMSHQYRDWRDFLIRCLDDYMSGSLYHLLQCQTLVGLFTCIFVKADLRDRIHNISASELKRGMGGLHGNKGAIAVRFDVDDSSICFVNCHLAAGQSHATQRNSDIAAILETPIFPSQRDLTVRMDRCVGGGDGTMVIDHELCVVNGDLNYRIDTMSRDTVVMAVKSRNLAKLLERDQLLVARRRNPGFKLRAFDEMPITFAPTYKYDVGTDNYDTSEKRRSPAWCDRLLSRGRGRIEQLDYRRHEVRVSDHRPVTGKFRFVVKRIEPIRRSKVWTECLTRWEEQRGREAGSDKLYYLLHVCGYDEASALKLIKDRDARRQRRNPSRCREESGR